MKKLILLSTVALLLFSCTPEDRVKFEEPQPSSIKEKNEFPSKIQATYVKYGNPNKTLIIKPKCIITNLLLQFNVSRSGVTIDTNANIDINNDSILISYMAKQGFSATIENDTISYNQIIHDTIFSLSSKNILKYYKRNYFLNYQFSDNYWRVKKLRVRGDTLYFGEILPNDTLLHFDYVSIDSNISKEQAKEYILSPSKHEFKKLMRSKAFSTTEKFIKQ